MEALCTDSQGAVWKAGDGLKRLDGAAPTNYIPKVGVLPHASRRVYCDRGGAFWIASGNSLFHLKDGISTNYKKADGPSGFISLIFQDREGELWLGTYSGVSRFEAGHFVSQDEADEPSYRVYSIFEDREGTLWVGSEEGLSRLTPKRFKTYTKETRADVEYHGDGLPQPGRKHLDRRLGRRIKPFSEGKNLRLRKDEWLVLGFCAGHA